MGDNEKNEKNENLIDKVLVESQSQEDRKNIDSIKSLNVVNLVERQLERVNSKDDLRDSVVAKLKEKVNTSENQDELNSVELIKLLEILEKSDNDMAAILFDAIKDTNLPKDSDNTQGELNVTVDDINKVKKIMTYLDILEAKEGS